MTNFIVALLMLMNASRAEVQAGPLAGDPALTARAQARAERMCATGRLSHDGWEQAFAGLRYQSSGENLAMGYQDPRQVHTQLMNSPGHRANILKREFRAAGIGHACNITVELFGG
ncbi:MAG: CAP domain-containing protein [Proteobacteria bacterium]|nr:CAP domain-containing protein [Pseudomonadota bacterium]